MTSWDDLYVITMERPAARPDLIVAQVHRRGGSGQSTIIRDGELGSFLDGVNAGIAMIESAAGCD